MNSETLQLSTSICYRKITDKGLQNLSRLRELNLGNNKNISDRGLKNLSYLRILDVKYNKNITEVFIENLKKRGVVVLHE